MCGGTDGPTEDIIPPQLWPAQWHNKIPYLRSRRNEETGEAKGDGFVV